MITLQKGTLTVTLRNPDFGNTDKVEIRRIQRKTRGGDLEIYRDPIWPRTEVFTLDFSFLKRIDLLNLINFIDQTVGEDITFTDHEGRVWTGIIITPSTDLAQPGRENFATSLEIQVQL